MTDSIQYITDTIPCSFPDTVSAAIPQVERMAGLTIPTTVGTEHWVGWLFLGLFSLLFLSWIFDNNILTDKLSVIRKYKERESIFKQTTLTNIYAVIFFDIFLICAISIHLYLITHEKNTCFSLSEYSCILIYTTIFYSIKYFLCLITEYTFMGKKKTKEKTWTGEYFNTLGMFGIVVFLSSILYAYNVIPNKEIHTIISHIIYVIILGIPPLKCVLFFLHKKAIFLYILLYLCTLEILPFLLLIHIIENATM